MSAYFWLGAEGEDERPGVIKYGCPPLPDVYFSVRMTDYAPVIAVGALLALAAVAAVAFSALA